MSREQIGEKTELWRQVLSSITDDDLDFLSHDCFRQATYIRKNNFGGGHAANQLEKIAVVIGGYKELLHERNDLKAHEGDAALFWQEKYEAERKKNEKLVGEIQRIHEAVVSLHAKQEEQHRHLMDVMTEVEKC